VTGFTRIRLTVHFSCIMTIDASHTSFPEMHVCSQILVLPKILISNSAPMTRRASSRHGGSAFEDMAVKKTAAYACRLTDVALSTGCMTVRAVVAEHLLDVFLGLLGWITPGAEGCLVSNQGVMQAFGLNVGEIRMAHTAGLVRLFAGITNQIGMGDVLLRIILALMALKASEFPMHGFAVRLHVDQYFFPCLQRRHITPSTFPC
jgi:hypothetical protein